MGKALAEAVLAAGHEVVIVSGPVEVTYPEQAELISVISTEEMLHECQRLFERCTGMIGVAAPCDYRPVRVEPHKISKTGQPLELRLVETPDIVATLGEHKRPDQWVVGFALETDDPRIKALVKLEKKHCDLIVLNGPEAMNSLDNTVDVMDRGGAVIASLTGPKSDVARGIFGVIQERLIRKS